MISLLLIIFGGIIFFILFQLSQFLESLTSKLTNEGDLDGILLTGIELLSPHFITKVQIITEQLLSIIDKLCLRQKSQGTAQPTFLKVG